MPSGVYKHKTLKEEGLKPRSIGFRDGSLLDDIEQVCKDPRIMSLAPENCRGRVYKTIWWGMRYLLKIIDSRSVRELPMFSDENNTAEVHHLHERIEELKAIEAGNNQTIDDLTRQLRKANIDLAKMRQVDYTVSWDNVSKSEEIQKIINEWIDKQSDKSKKFLTTDGNEQAFQVFKDLYESVALFEEIYINDYGILPDTELLQNRVEQIRSSKYPI